MPEAFDDILRRTWREDVQSKYMYRGMSVKDLCDPLDPSFDPFAEIRPELDRLLTLLEDTVANGFEFTVVEDYSGFSFPLRNILAWTRNDLNNPGLDFMSVHAGGYAQNFQGSQLKQNFRFITAHLPEHRNDPTIRARLTADDWELVSEVNAWMSRKDPRHKPVVIWVRRTCLAFETDPIKRIPVGSFEYLRDRVLERLAEQGLPQTAESVAKVLPGESQTFDIRVMCPLPLSEIEKVEDVHA